MLCSSITTLPTMNFAALFGFQIQTPQYSDRYSLKQPYFGYLQFHAQEAEKFKPLLHTQATLKECY